MAIGAIVAVALAASSFFVLGRLTRTRETRIVASRSPVDPVVNGMPPKTEDSIVIQRAATSLRRDFDEFYAPSMGIHERVSDPSNFSWFRIEYGIDPDNLSEYDAKLHPLFNPDGKPMYDRYGQRAYEGGCRNGVGARVWFRAITSSGFVQLICVPIYRAADGTWNAYESGKGGGKVVGYDPDYVRHYGSKSAGISAGRYWIELLGK